MSSDRNNPAYWEEILRRDGLAAGEFNHTRAKRKPIVAAKVEYFALALEFLEAHAFASRWDRQVWELHAGGLSNPKIARRLPGGYRKKVQETVVRLRTLMLGRISGKRGRGRPPVPDGRGDDCLRVTVRFNEVEAGAVAHIENAHRAAGRAVPSVRAIVRTAVLELARRI